MDSEDVERVKSLLSEVRDELENVQEGGEEKVYYDREVYLEEFERVCNRFDVEVELQEDSDKDSVYSEWSEHVNMSAGELRKWSRNPCSRQASEDPVAVIKRNLRLLEKNKEDWTADDVEDAERTISFISRMKPNRPDSPREGPHGCPSEWAISLLNWAFNPFDSVPTPSSEVKEKLDPVETVELSELQADYSFSPVPDQVLYSTEELAMERAESMGLEGVHTHTLVVDGEERTMYMPGSEHVDWAENVRHPRQLSDEEMSETRKASQVVHGDQEKHLNSSSSSEDDKESVRVPPVAIHKVESGGNREVSEDVENVLDELWDDDDDDNGGDKEEGE